MDYISYFLEMRSPPFFWVLVFLIQFLFTLYLEDEVEEESRWTIIPMGSIAWGLHNDSGPLFTWMNSGASSILVSWVCSVKFVWPDSTCDCCLEAHYFLASIARGYRDFHVRREDRRMRGEEQNSPRGLEVTVVNSDLVHDGAGAMEGNRQPNVV